MPTSRGSAPGERTSLRNLILVGLPGAGKTTVGRAVANALGRPFLDFDEEIERREGITIAEIFSSKGEPYFRALESRLTMELSAASGKIVSPGGGWITDPKVVEHVRPSARIVYLCVSPETALSRLGDGRSTRPLLSGDDPLGELQRLFKKRRPSYETADIVVNVELLSLQQVIEAIVALVGVDFGP